MKIAFDVTPLVGDLVSGIGWCESGLITALGRLHPEHTYRYEYFSLRTPEVKEARLRPHMLPDTQLCPARFSPMLYRAMSACLPIPYRWFFGKEAALTHFFNYIVPPGVAGKTVVTVHDMVIHAYPETVRFRTKQMLRMGLAKSMRRADRIVTDSEFSKREILKYYPACEEKLRVVPCGVNLQRFHPETPERIAAVREKFQLPERYFLYLGTLEPRKNLERLLDGYDRFAQQTEQPPRLVLAGGRGWMYDGILSKAQDKGLRELVQLTEYVPSEDLCAMVCGAEAFVFPSLYEGFGMPPLEAMACGTPVLTSNAASLPEVVGDCAVSVDPYSVEEIAEGLGRLHSDPALRRDLSARGLARAQTFTWDAAAQRLYQVYGELLA